MLLLTKWHQELNMLICLSGISVSACRKQENRRIRTFASKEVICHLSPCINYSYVLQKRDLLFCFQLARFGKQKINFLKKLLRKDCNPLLRGSRYAFAAICSVSASLGKNQHRHASLCHPIKYSKNWTVLEQCTPWDLYSPYKHWPLSSHGVVKQFWNRFQNLPMNTGKSLLCSHVWSTVGCSGKRAEPLEFGGMWPSSGSLDLNHLGRICWTCRYLASPPYTALPVPRGGRRGIQELMLQPRHCASTPGKAGIAGPRGNMELPRAPDRVSA